MKQTELRVRDDYERVGGQLSYWEQSVLCGLARLVQPRRILETGTLFGATSKILSDACPEADVLSVDRNPDRIEAARDSYAACRLHFIHGQAIELLETFRPSVDLVFLDDSHGSDHVREEIETALEFQHPEMIVVHDVVPNNRFGLSEVVEEFGGFVIDLPIDKTAGGLGVI